MHLTTGDLLLGFLLGFGGGAAILGIAAFLILGPVFKRRNRP